MGVRQISPDAGLAETPYKNGKKEGVAKVYNEDGSLDEERVFKNDQSVSSRSGQRKKKDEDKQLYGL